jgi:CRP/FNR family transcriptional regulator
MHAFRYFNALTQTQQEKIKQAMVKIELDKGDTLYDEGDVVPFIYFIFKGSLRIQRYHESGHSVMLYRVDAKSEQNIDIASAPNETPAIGSAFAESDALIYSIDLKILQHILGTDPKYHTFLFEMAMQRTEYLAEMVKSVRFHTLDERILAWLKQKSQKALDITHEEIACCHGTSREVVSRVLKKFEKKGLLKLSRKEILLLDA